MRSLLTPVVGFAALVATSVGVVVAAPASQTGDKPLPKIWTGAFTVQQAERGRATFLTRCAHCHSEDLSGGDGPALIGANFSRNWGSRTVERLFKKVKERMPPGEEFLVSEAEKLDIVTMLLAANGFPAGKAELTKDPAVLSDLLIVGKNGPEPAPTGAMVEVLGCLAEDGAAWKFTNSTEPLVSSMDDVAGDAKAAVSRPLGTLTIRLLDVFPKPDEHKGHKMIAKGLLIRGANESHINVLAMEMVAPTCP